MLDDHNTETNAVNELKRADHLLFVTLKYTRSCDIIKSIIHRLIGAFDLAVIDALTSLYKKKKIKKIPLTPISRVEELKNTSKKIEILDFVNFYYLLRFVYKAEYTKREEFKRHVTLTVMQDDEAVEVDIDKVHVYYNKTKEFVEYVGENFK